MRHTSGARALALAFIFGLCLPSVRPSALMAQEPEASPSGAPQQPPSGSIGWAVEAARPAAQPEPQAASKKNRKLDSQLVQTVQVARERGAGAALEEAEARSLKVVDSAVRVVVEAGSSDRGRARAAVAAVGRRIEAEHADLIQALVPPSSLEALAAHPDVRYVRPPFISEPDAVSGQGVQATNASAWHAAGQAGAGAKVAVIDGGFAGYTTRQASGDLPASLVAQNFCSGGFEANTDHGTAVAEIVHEMAPAAQLYLVCVGTEVQLGQAKDYAKAQGIQVINHSVSWFNTSRGDGSGGAGTPDAIVADARASGILWVNSVGNRAQMHWSGAFSDTDGDDYHNFSGADEGNSVFLSTGARVCVFLKWDNWPTSSQDFDLYLGRPSDGVLVAISETAQSGSQRPVEQFCYTNPAASQVFEILIFRFAATSAPRFDLFVAGPTLQYQIAEGSVTEPGSSPNAMAVGAICWQNDALEPYSSRGPTIDGRIKPDIAGQDSVSTATDGPFAGCGTSGFTGTSAAAPHVAGAAALVKGANPGFGAAQLQAFLEGRAIDLGPAGKDNSFGAGKLSLGAPPTSVSCSPRPRVTISAVPAGAGRLQVSVAATGANNTVRELRFGAATNALIDVGGQSGRPGNFAVSLPSGANGVTFFVRRASAGAATTVPFVVADGCGDWPTFVGGGPSAF